MTKLQQICIKRRIDYSLLESLIQNYYIKVLGMKEDDARKEITLKVITGKFDRIKDAQFTGIHLRNL